MKVVRSDELSALGRGSRARRPARRRLGAACDGRRATGVFCLPGPARTFEHDEFIRDETTAEQLAALPVQPGTTQMTAANSTPLTDGASVLVLASGERAAQLGIDPLARVVSSAVYALDLLIMGLAPAWALPLAIKRAVLTPE
jgi:acetyl-CoA acetyltransferase